MKKILLSIALAFVAPFAWAQVSETTTTTTTTDANGTITEYTPGSAIVLRETSGPVRYRFGKTVTYVTRSGRVLDTETLRTRVKVGVPVRVHYSGTGDNMVVDLGQRLRRPLAPTEGRGDGRRSHPMRGAGMVPGGSVQRASRRMPSERAELCYGTTPCQ